MLKTSTCPECNGSNLYVSDEVSAGGGYAPNYLPGLGIVTICLKLWFSEPTVFAIQDAPVATTIPALSRLAVALLIAGAGLIAILDSSRRRR